MADDFDQTPAGQGYSENDSLRDRQGDRGEPSFEQDDTSEGSGQVSRTYAGKYKTVDDLEKGYREAERKITESGQTTAQMKRQLDELQAFQAQMQQAFGGRTQMSAEEYRQLASEAMENDPVGYVNHVINQQIQQTEERRRHEESAKDAWSNWVSRDENREFTDPKMQQALHVAIQNLNQNPQTAYLDPFSKLEAAKKTVDEFFAGVNETRKKAQLNKERALSGMAAMEVGTQNAGQGQSDENKPQSYSDYMAERQKARERLSRRT